MYHTYILALDWKSQVTMTNTCFSQDSIIDVKLSSNKIWILERDGVVMHNLSDPTDSG